jgi:ankyrin repeat protein
MGDIYVLSLCLDEAITLQSNNIVNFLLDNQIYFNPVEKMVMRNYNEQFLRFYHVICKYEKILVRCFMIAIIYGNKIVADLLSVNIKMNERIHEIVQKCDARIIDTYVYYNVDINYRNSKGETPIMLAIKLKKHEHVAKLLSYNCEVDKTVLDLAHEYDLHFELIHKIRKIINDKFKFAY